ncbi:MAG: UDP-4-amino-4,6-dideoxy-N-acetyl-beta-L-altrosamine N-acetyltransferase [Candidatus Omnitrophica bacterium]|nr:UDP-4-amino-4,6-dideoxy-N-acetyl-beta-L-altrosamine N-acetyltransferase [Candidatus Omnitrophota bacterium]
MSKLEFKNILDVDPALQKQVRNWRNQDDVRRYMINQSLISEEQHQSWLDSLNQKKDKYWIVYLENNPVGMVYLTDVDEEKRSSSWGFYIADYSNRGRGLGKAILQKLLTLFFDEMNFSILKTQVLATNEKALRIYDKFSFRKINIGKKDGIIEYEFDQKDWDLMKNKIMPKKVILLLDFIDLNQVEATILEKSEFIAVTPGAMLALEERNLSYKTFDDFFEIQEFREGLIKLLKESEIFFSELDEMFKDQLKYPWIFTGNMYWFWVVFVDMYYLNKVCAGIKMDYDQVYLIGIDCKEENFAFNIDFSQKGLIFDKYYGKVSKIKFLKEMLNPECCWVSDKLKTSWTYEKIKQSLIYFCERIRGKLTLKLQEIKTNPNLKKENIFVIQDGYDLKPLRRHLKGYNFVNPIKEALTFEHRAVKLNADEQEFDQKVRGFIHRWFQECEPQMFELFKQYREKVITEFSLFSSKVLELFNRYDPKVLLYAAGSNGVIEQYFTFYANRRNIPVISFQHGLTTIFFDNPYRKYAEQNCLGNHFKVLNSKKEKEYYVRNNLMDSIALGAITLYEKHQSLLKKKAKNSSAKKKSVLYCPIYFNYNCYKELIFNCCDKDLLKVNKDIIQLVKHFQLKMDIKLHVVCIKDNDFYFQRLLKKYSAKNTKILTGFPVEQIIDEYGLIILDYHATILLPMTIILQIPIIVYLKDFYSLREEYVSELQRIFYIVRNREDLEMHLKSFKQGTLPSKYDPEFVDQYCYPVNQGDVGANIAQLVVNRIENARIVEPPVLVN